MSATRVGPTSEGPMFKVLTKLPKKSNFRLGKRFMRKQPLKQIRPPWNSDPNPPRKPLRRVGRKTLQWQETRKKLKLRFNTAGITTCEIKFPQCWKDYCLYFCHTLRRADIKTQEELERVVLGCAACSTACHGMGKVKEEEFLEKIIQSREAQP